MPEDIELHRPYIDAVTLKCPKCGQRVRVPRHKGKLLVSCPKCHTKFDARS